MAKKIRGITVQLGGDTSGLRKALEQADKALNSTQRELREVEKGLKFDPQNTVLMAQKQELLKKAIGAAADKLKELEANQEKAAKAFAANDDWEEQYAPLKEEIDKTNAALKNLYKEQDKAKKEFESGGISKEQYEQVTAAVEETKNKLRDLNDQEKELEKHFADGHISAEQYREYQRETEKTRANLESLKKQLAETESAADKTDGAFEEAADSADKLGDSAEEAKQKNQKLAGELRDNIADSAKKALPMVTALTAAIGAMLKKSIEAGMEFDSAMAQVAATMGVTVDEVAQLRDFAKEMGAQTTFSATESAEALNYMALAGYDAEEQMEMLPPVLNLAASGIMDLSSASDMVTDSQTALGLSTEETRLLIDQMAKTSSTTNTSVAQLGEALLTVGGTAKQLKGGTREMSQVLGILADNGVKASEAGTHLRNIILAMQPTTAEAAAAFEELGLQTYDAEGNMRAFQDIFGDLSAKMSEMTSEERQKSLSDIFNKTDLTSVNALLDTSVTRWNEVGTAIDGAEGSAKAMAETQLDNLSGDITIMKSALEGTEIALSDKVTPALRKLAKKGTEDFSELTEVIGEKGAGAALELLPSLAREGVAEIHRTIDSELGETADKVFAVETAVKSGIAAFIAYKSAMTLTEAAQGISAVISLIKGATTATEALNAAGLANPYVLLATAAVGAVTALKSVIDTQADLIDEAELTYSSLTDEQQEFIKSNDDLAGTISDRVKAAQDSIDSVNTEAGAIGKMRDELYKLDDAENLSNDQKERMQALVNSLNDSMPDLNLQLDEETGHLKNQRDEIDKLIESYKKQAKAQAAQEQLEEMYKQQIEAEESLRKATEERAKAEEKYNEIAEKKNKLLEEYKNYLSAANTGQLTTQAQSEMTALEGKLATVNEELKLQKNALGDLNGTFVTASESVRTVNNSIDALSVLAAESSTELDGMSDSSEQAAENVKQSAAAVKEYAGVVLENVNGINQMTFNLNGQTVTLSEETAESIGKLIDEYDSMIESQRQAIEGSVDFYGGFEADSSVTFENLMQNLSSSNFAINDWATAIEQLGQKGISQGLLDELKGMGLGSYDIVRELNHSTDGQLQEYSDLWNQTHTDINAIAEQQMGKLKETTQQEIYKVAGLPSANIDMLRKEFSKIGINADEGIVEGMKKRFEEVNAEARKVGDTVIDGTKESMMVESPSKKGIEIGKFFDEGLSIGISENADGPAAAARDMVRKMILEVKHELDSHSPSRVMKKLGVTVPQGLAKGIDKECETAMQSARQMTDDLIKEISRIETFKIDPRDVSVFSEVRRFHEVTPQELQRDTLRDVTSSLSGNVTVNLNIDDNGANRLAEVIVPKADLMFGREITLSERGLATK